MEDGIARKIVPEDMLKYSTVGVVDEFVVDLMKQACEVDFESASGHIEYFELDGVKIPFLDVEKMLESKKGARPIRGCLVFEMEETKPMKKIKAIVTGNKEILNRCIEKWVT